MQDNIIRQMFAGIKIATGEQIPAAPTTPAQPVQTETEAKKKVVGMPKSHLGESKKKDKPQVAKLNGVEIQPSANSQNGAPPAPDATGNAAAGANTGTTNQAAGNTGANTGTTGTPPDPNKSQQFSFKDFFGNLMADNEQGQKWRAGIGTALGGVAGLFAGGPLGAAAGGGLGHHFAKNLTGDKLKSFLGNWGVSWDKPAAPDEAATGAAGAAGTAANTGAAQQQ